MLGWLLGEPRGDAVRKALGRAESVLASDITLVECDRILIRKQTSSGLPEAEAIALRAALDTASAHWTIMRVEGEIVDRARRPFPGEPIRTLDALHLASALVAHAAIGDLGVLTLDDRIRAAARALGLRIVPA